MDTIKLIFIGCVSDVHKTRTDILVMHFRFVLHALPCQHSIHMRQNGLKGPFPDNFSDFFADQILRPVAEHSRKCFAYIDVTQIGTATSEQKWRVAQNSLSVGARCQFSSWGNSRPGGRDGFTVGRRGNERKRFSSTLIERNKAS